jgi:single-strand DNA-binding protein
VSLPQGLNRVTLIGRLARGPEIRRAPSGLAACTFTVSVPRSVTGADGQVHSVADLFNVVAWAELAEWSERELAADALAYVEGRLQVRTWTDSEGRQHQQTEVVAATILPLSLEHSEATWSQRS